MPLSSKASNGLSRKERLEALEKSRALAPFIDLVNKPDDSQQLLQKILPSYNKVSAHIPRTLASPLSWRDEEIEDYIEAQERADEELANKLAALEEERQTIAGLLGRLADSPQSNISPFVDSVELPVGLAHQTRLVFGAQNRIHVELLFPEIAELWKAFLKALDGLDRSASANVQLAQTSTGLSGLISPDAAPSAQAGFAASVFTRP